MKGSTVLTIAGLGLLAYLLLRKKSVSALDTSASGAAPAPSAAAAPVAPVTVTKTVQGLDDKIQNNSEVRLGRSRSAKKAVIMPEDIKVPAVEPIYVSPVNLIPNVYDRGVGQPTMNVAANGEGYYNLSGNCSESIQKACRCQEKKQPYKLDIPSLN